MRVAAIQLCARFGDVPANLRKAERLLEEALEKGAQWAILPEFFTSAVGFHPSLLNAALPLEGPAHALMKKAAQRHHAYVGGSFICRRGDDNYNTFVLVFPDGSYVTHDKDMPTMWENCYYIGGNDDGVLDTPIGKVGAALCWEYVRTQTARRLKGKVEMIIGGTCWWDFPRGQKLPESLTLKNRRILFETPQRMARMVGAPVVHASHAGDFVGDTPYLPLKYDSMYLGETQIVDATGNVLARRTREEGEGVITAEIQPGKVSATEEIPDRFWIPDLPLQIRFAWFYQNLHGRRYYRKMKAAGMLGVAPLSRQEQAAAH
ncbi:MAG: carbon-nitrogen hydrolase family protein [Candidatus Abyssobacteria bacterium SURF_5]|uniref:Carbon-nitrogen hydrolase family protein n=1 Tax=Abyssobacteria bacterium (strain SURF_5) TaxID=2093360 RepID=A0A3A4NH40_ABYX5|nr:MAG: carbon-nitrogen hydrolase family protein [Candidatus Abyssubacteria bacterium SURF_5]